MEMDEEIHKGRGGSGDWDTLTDKQVMKIIDFQERITENVLSILFSSPF